jgi:hypothetical protein
MSAKPKKAGSEKPASTPTPKATPPASPAAAVADGARPRRLARAGFEGADRCALLDIELDIGPRATPWQIPVKLIGDVVSTLGASIIASGAPPEALELAAARLRQRSGS